MHVWLRRMRSVSSLPKQEIFRVTILDEQLIYHW